MPADTNSKTPRIKASRIEDLPVKPGVRPDTFPDLKKRRFFLIEYAKWDSPKVVLQNYNKPLFWGTPATLTIKNP